MVAMTDARVDADQPMSVSLQFSRINGPRLDHGAGSELATRSALTSRCGDATFLTAQANVALPTGAGIMPILLAHRSPDCALDAFGQTQFEQVGLATLLGFAYDRLIAETDIAADQPSPLFGRQAIEQPPTEWRAMLLAG
jgi:hypothetical protein